MTSTTVLTIVVLLVATLLISATVHAEQIYLEGASTQGGLVQGLVPSGTRVSVDGRPVRVSDTGIFLVGIGRDDVDDIVIRATLVDGQVHERVIQITARDYQIQRIDGLPQSKVTPDASVLDRIHRETALVKARREIDAPRTDFLTGFMWPAQGRISGVYGSQRILNGEPRRPHFGIDVAAPVGTPVYAPADGIVTLTHEDMYFSGGTLIIDHGHGLSSAFLHLSRILVSEDEVVRRGDLIAEIGATGRATGPHLDWRMNLLDKRIDPELLVGPMN